MVFKFERKSTEKNVKKERIGAYYGKNSVIGSREPHVKSLSFGKIHAGLAQ